MNDILLGQTYRDLITGFQGVAIGYVDYISGCNQALLTPKCSPDGPERESRWIDVQRLEALAEVPRIQLDNGKTPGFDKAPPLR